MMFCSFARWDHQISIQRRNDVSRFCNKYIAIVGINLKSYFLRKIEATTFMQSYWFSKQLSLETAHLFTSCALLRFGSLWIIYSKNLAVGIRFSNFRKAFIKGKNSVYSGDANIYLKMNHTKFHTTVGQSAPVSLCCLLPFCLFFKSFEVTVLLHFANSTFTTDNRSSPTSERCFSISLQHLPERHAFENPMRIMVTMHRSPLSIEKTASIRKFAFGMRPRDMLRL